MADRASSFVPAIITPLPAHSPSAFITIGRGLDSICAFALSLSVKNLKSAVFTPKRLMASFADTLLASSCAEFLSGPKIRRPWALNASTMPFVSGASGPTTVRPIEFVFAKSSRDKTSSASISTHSAISDMPPFPGAQ